MDYVELRTEDGLRIVVMNFFPVWNIINGEMTLGHSENDCISSENRYIKNKDSYLMIGQQAQID